MSLRSHLAQGVLKTAQTLPSLIPAFLKPQELMALNETYYQEKKEGALESFQPELYEDEKRLLSYLPARSRILCLGAGLGREALALAELGYETWGIENVPELASFAKTYAETHHLSARFILANVLDLPDLKVSFDCALLLNCFYNLIPGRRLRQRLLSSVKRSLVPQGICILQLTLRPTSEREKKWHRLLKSLAQVLGNPEYEMGDRMVDAGLYYHFFSSFEQAWGEIKEAGFNLKERLSLDGFYTTLILQSHD